MQKQRAGAGRQRRLASRRAHPEADEVEQLGVQERRQREEEAEPAEVVPERADGVGDDLGLRVRHLDPELVVDRRRCA